MNPSITFAYVVLQYGNFDVTRQCIESIGMIAPNSQIIIVDNCSPDSAAEQANQYSKSHQNITLIKLRSNTGFSHGNNIGYVYARNTLKADFIVVLNNDIEIRQRDFEDAIGRIYNECAFAVLGPDIFIPSSRIHQNPFNVNGPTDIWHPDKPTLKDINFMLQTTAEMIRDLGKPSTEPSILQRIKHSSALSGIRALRRNLLTQRAERLWRSNWTGRYENVPLQGACYIFSPPYIKTMHKCFSPEPFLYCEEILLQMNCDYLGLKMVYDSSIQVIHHESTTTERLFDESDNNRKKLFRLQNNYSSLLLCGERCIELGKLNVSSSGETSELREFNDYMQSDQYQYKNP